MKEVIRYKMYSKLSDGQKAKSKKQMALKAGVAWQWHKRFLFATCSLRISTRQYIEQCFTDLTFASFDVRFWNQNSKCKKMKIVKEGIGYEKYSKLNDGQWPRWLLTSERLWGRQFCQSLYNPEEAGPRNNSFVFISILLNIN